MKPSMKNASQDTEWEDLRQFFQHQAPATPPETVREQLLQRVKNLRPALLSPPLTLKIWGAFLALWLFAVLAWLWPPGPALTWTCEVANGQGFVIYRQTNAGLHPVGYVPISDDEGHASYEFVEAYHVPLQLRETYVIAALEPSGAEVDRIAVPLSAWLIWLDYAARIFFSFSAAAFVVNWLHWRDVQHHTTAWA